MFKKQKNESEKSVDDIVAEKEEEITSFTSRVTISDRYKTQSLGKTSILVLTETEDCCVLEIKGKKYTVENNINTLSRKKFLIAFETQLVNITLFIIMLMCGWYTLEDAFDIQLEFNALFVFLGFIAFILITLFTLIQTKLTITFTDMYLIEKDGDKELYKIR